MRVAKNLKDLEKLLVKEYIKPSMENEVSAMSRKKLKEHIQTDVYDGYLSSAANPYERTGKLLQDENIETDMIDDYTLSIRSTRQEDGRDVAAVLETGQGYTWEHSEIYKTEQKREFHKKTAEELEGKGLARKALAEGLKKRGLVIK